jgi:hypothetical protein
VPGAWKPELHEECLKRVWLCTTCKPPRPGANTAIREKAKKLQDEKQEMKKQQA